MISITIPIPTTLQLATIAIDLPVDDSPYCTFLDSAGTTLHRIDEGVPEFLRAPYPVNKEKVSLEIDLSSGRILNWIQPTPDQLAAICASCRDTHFMLYSCKVRDELAYRLKNAAGQVVLTQSDGYVPNFLPGDDSDYLDFEIELQTGIIAKWTQFCTGSEIGRVFRNADNDPSLKISLPEAA